MHGAGIDLRKVRRVKDPLQPIEGESLLGFVARTAHHNVLETVYTISRESGWKHGNRPALATGAVGSLTALAHSLKVDPAEVQRRAHAELESEAGRLEFFGSSVHRFELETRYRRFAPGALTMPPYHRAIWEVRWIGFSTETWEMLIDQCHTCGTRQGWRFANGIATCDFCGDDLRQAPTGTVPEHMREHLAIAADLVDPNPLVRAGALAQLPTELSGLEADDACELLLRLLPIADPEGGYGRRAKIIQTPPDVLVRALHKAASLLVGWPQAVIDNIGDALVSRKTKYDDGKGGASKRFFRLRHEPAVPAAVRDVIRALHDSLDCERLEGSEARPDIKSVALQIGLGTRFIADHRRAGNLRTKLGIRSGFLVPSFDPVEVDYLARAKRDRLSLEGASRKLGISYHGTEQLACLGHLQLLEHRFLLAYYKTPQTTHASFGAFLDRLKAASKPLHPEGATLTLRKAAMVIGGRQKPWGPIFDSLITGELAFTLVAGDRCLIDRIFINAADAACISDLTFHKDPFPDFVFDASMSKVDAGETLNLAPQYYTPLLQHHTATRKERNYRAVPVAEVNELAQRFISTSELAARAGLTPTKAFELVQAHNLQWAGEGLWLRREVEPILERRATTPS